MPAVQASKLSVLTLCSCGPAQIAGVPLAGISTIKAAIGWIGNNWNPSYQNATRLSRLCDKKLTEVKTLKNELVGIKNEIQSDNYTQLQPCVDKMNAIRQFANMNIVDENCKVDRITQRECLRKECLSTPKNAFKGSISSNISVTERANLVVKDLELSIKSAKRSLKDKKGYFDSKRFTPEKDLSNALFYGISIIPIVGTLIATYFIPSFWK
jgi:hypothetical protein